MIPRTSPGPRFVTNASLSRRPRTATRRSDASLPVVSNAIDHLDYNVATQELTVTFARGGSYIISGVPEIEAHRFATAESPGRYFNAFIRGRY